MNRILAALILSTAAIGAAQAGELGYADNPGHNNETSQNRGQYRNDVNTDRAQVQGQRAPSQVNTGNNNESREQLIREQRAARPTNAAGVTFVNG
jgi:hypothetical protein